MFDVWRVGNTTVPEDKGNGVMFQNEVSAVLQNIVEEHWRETRKEVQYVVWQKIMCRIIGKRLVR